MSQLPLSPSTAAVHPSPSPRRPRGGVPGALLKAMRPHQWTKNVLVIVAPTFAGKLTDVSVLGHTAIAFVAFCLVSSSVYLINDSRDVNEDRAHPRKRYRPIAAGWVSPRIAVITALILAAVSIVLGLGVDLDLAVVVATYFATNMAYCLFLKDEAVIDIAIIASGFLLRAVAGGVASHIALSQWFLLIATFGSLFMAAGKRYAEVRQLGEGQAATRKSLAKYTSTYLRFVWSVAAALLIMSYALWAFQIAHKHHGPVPWPQISMAPFILAVLRYAVDVDAGRASEPDEIALSDRTLQFLAVAWVACVALAVYTG